MRSEPIERLETIGADRQILQVEDLPKRYRYLAANRRFTQLPPLARAGSAHPGLALRFHQGPVFGPRNRAPNGLRTRSALAHRAASDQSSHRAVDCSLAAAKAALGSTTRLNRSAQHGEWTYESLARNGKLLLGYDIRL
jgi:hypothetical protein